MWKTEQTKLTYQPALDGLRALAVSAVVIYHYDPAYLPGGWAGVDLFFVLSGYLITRLLLKERQESGRIDLKRFYIRRFLRLTPALWLLFAFVIAYGLATKLDAQLVGSVAISGLYLMNLFRAFGLGTSHLLGHTWSLAMEEQFYILWPIVLIALHERNMKRCTAGLILAVIVWRCFLVYMGAEADRTYNGFDTHADALLIGCFAAMFAVPQRIQKVASRTVALPLFGMATFFVAVHMNRDLTQSAGLTIASLLSLWLIVAALYPGSIQRVLSMRPLVFTGRVSYGFYLWHFPLLQLAADHFDGRYRWLALPVAYAAAVISFYTVERYFTKLKARFDEKAEPRANTLGEQQIA